MNTVLILAHPTFEASRVNRALVEGVADLPGLEIADLYRLYPDHRIDLATERERLLRADRLVLQFPLQWYSTPALLKEWQDAVLTPLFYFEPAVAAATAGLPVMAATTTGGPLTSYRPGGSVNTIEALLAPLEATARKCGWSWHTPFAVHDTRNIDDSALTDAARTYRAAVMAIPDLRSKDHA